MFLSLDFDPHFLGGMAYVNIVPYLLLAKKTAKDGKTNPCLVLYLPAGYAFVLAKAILICFLKAYGGIPGIWSPLICGAKSCPGDVCMQFCRPSSRSLYNYQRRIRGGGGGGGAMGAVAPPPPPPPPPPFG